MSELKEHKFCESDEFFREYHGTLSNEAHLYYLKSEADKYIQELEEKRFNDLQDAEDSFKSILELNHKEIRHHKYKRCLAMAEWCETNVYNIRRKPLCDMDDHEGWQHDDEFWQRWQKRWLELAENFKEAK